MAGIYIHIPFCIRKCPYCDFVSFAGEDGLYAPYVRALITEAGLRRNEVEDSLFDTIYIGGGTPSLLPAPLISQLLSFLRSHYSFSSAWEDVEISIEANPESVSGSWLSEVREAGVNRISIGVQDFSEQGLGVLQRPHSVLDALHAVTIAGSAGFESLSIDLMFALPGQDVEQLVRSLETACNCGCDHISCYELTVEPNTRLWRMVEAGEVEMPCEETAAIMTDLVEKTLESHGYFQYEISNFALPGKECRHNVNYWENGPYIGFGCSAVSYTGGMRSRNSSVLSEYMDRILSRGTAAVFEERLDDEARFRETVVLGLRMNRGVSSQWLSGEFGIDLKEFYGESLARLVDGGLVCEEDGRFRLTCRGRRIANSVMSELV